MATRDFVAWVTAAVSVCAAAAARGEVIVIPACAFAPVDSATAYFRNAVFLRGNTAGQMAVFLAPVDIPDGATITSVRAVVDDDATQNVTLRLWAAGSFSSTAITSVVSSGTPSVTTLTAPASHTADIDVFAYSVEVSWVVPTQVDAIRVNAVRVEYTPPTGALPCGGDINRDGVVDGRDLQVMLAQFGAVCGG